MSVPELDEYRKSIGVLFQSGALFNSMSVAENVALPLHEHTDLPPSTIDIMVKIKLELVGLREHADRLPERAERRHEEAGRPGPGGRAGPQGAVLRRAQRRAWTR